MVVKWIVLAEILRIKMELHFYPLSSLLRRFTDENREKNKKWHNSVRAIRKEVQRREANYSSSDVPCLYSQSPYRYGFVPLPKMQFQVFIKR